MGWFDPYLLSIFFVSLAYNSYQHHQGKLHYHDRKRQQNVHWPLLHKATTRRWRRGNSVLSNQIHLFALQLKSSKITVSPLACHTSTVNKTTQNNSLSRRQKLNIKLILLMIFIKERSDRVELICCVWMGRMKWKTASKIIEESKKLTVFRRKSEKDDDVRISTMRYIENE